MRGKKKRQVSAYVALLPAFLIVIFAYVVTVGWNIWISFTDSKLLPVNSFAGTKQYDRLFAMPRRPAREPRHLWRPFHRGLPRAVLLAVALDQRIRFENTFRTIFLYPFAMSHIVTGLVWQWIMNPTLGVDRTLKSYGIDFISLGWIVQNDKAIYVIVVAGVWQSSGLVMAIMLAGLRGIDGELWKATRIDGIPPWRVYLHVVLPMMRPTIITATVLSGTSVVRLFELVLATTGGGPGISTEVPGKFIMDYLFGRSNIGLATSAATVMFICVSIVVIPWLYGEYFREKRERAA